MLLVNCMAANISWANWSPFSGQLLLRPRCCSIWVTACRAQAASTGNAVGNTASVSGISCRSQRSWSQLFEVQESSSCSTPGRSRLGRKSARWRTQSRTADWMSAAVPAARWRFISVRMLAREKTNQACKQMHISNRVHLKGTVSREKLFT